MFDIADADADSLITFEEDQQLMALQRMDSSLAELEGPSGERHAHCEREKLKVCSNDLFFGWPSHVRSAHGGRVYNIMGPSNGPDILLFKYFQLSWSNLHQPQDARPLVKAPPDVLRFIETTMGVKQPRDDYLKFIHLVARVVGLRVDGTLLLPGARQRCCY